jgi:hypothetical protein
MLSNTEVVNEEKGFNRKEEEIKELDANLQRRKSKERKALKKERASYIMEYNRKIHAFKETTKIVINGRIFYDWEKMRIFMDYLTQERAILNALKGVETCIGILNKLKKQGKLLRPTNSMLDTIKVSFYSENRERLLNLFNDEEYFIRKDLKTELQRQRYLGREREQLESASKNIQPYYERQRQQVEQLEQLEQLERNSYRLHLCCDLRRYHSERESKKRRRKLEWQLDYELERQKTSIST